MKTLITIALALLCSGGYAQKTEKVSKAALDTMKIIAVSVQRDGGTREIILNTDTLWLDNRIGTKTRYKLYTSYPADSGSVMIMDRRLTDKVMDLLFDFENPPDYGF